MEGILSPEDDLYFLRRYSQYDNSPTKKEYCAFQYVNQKLDALADYLPKKFFTNCEDDFSFAVQLMLWVHKFLIADGEVIPVRPFHCLNILEKTRTEGVGSNCWMFSVVLNEILLSFGYKSRVIRCMPMDLRFNDCHCIVQAYIKKYNKWVALDPSFGTYYTDVQKNPINLQELRKSIIRGDPFCMPFKPAKYSKSMTAYWYKNIFRFETYAVSKFNTESDPNSVVIYALLPAGYELVSKRIQYRNRESHWIYIHNEKEFWKGPDDETFKV
jgi:hypothetical protein